MPEGGAIGAIEFVLTFRDQATPGIEVVRRAIATTAQVSDQATSRLSALGAAMERVGQQAIATSRQRLDVASQITAGIPGGTAALEGFGQKLLATQRRGDQATSTYGALATALRAGVGPAEAAGNSLEHFGKKAGEAHSATTAFTRGGVQAIGSLFPGMAQPIEAVVGRLGALGGALSALAGPITVIVGAGALLTQRFLGMQDAAGKTLVSLTNLSAGIDADFRAMVQRISQIEAEAVGDKRRVLEAGFREAVIIARKEADARIAIAEETREAELRANQRGSTIATAAGALAGGIAGSFLGPAGTLGGAAAGGILVRTILGFEEERQQIEAKFRGDRAAAEFANARMIVLAERQKNADILRDERERAQSEREILAAGREAAQARVSAIPALIGPGATATQNLIVDTGLEKRGKDIQKELTEELQRIELNGHKGIELENLRAVASQAARDKEVQAEREAATKRQDILNELLQRALETERLRVSATQAALETRAQRQELPGTPEGAIEAASTRLDAARSANAAELKEFEALERRKVERAEQAALEIAAKDGEGSATALHARLDADAIAGKSAADLAAKRSAFAEDLAQKEIAAILRVRAAQKQASDEQIAALQSAAVVPAAKVEATQIVGQSEQALLAARTAAAQGAIQSEASLASARQKSAGDAIGAERTLLKARADGARIAMASDEDRARREVVLLKNQQDGLLDQLRLSQQIRQEKERLLSQQEQGGDLADAKRTQEEINALKAQAVALEAQLVASTNQVAAAQVTAAANAADFRRQIEGAQKATGALEATSSRLPDVFADMTQQASRIAEEINAAQQAASQFGGSLQSAVDRVSELVQQLAAGTAGAAPGRQADKPEHEKEILNLQLREAEIEGRKAEAEAIKAHLQALELQHIKDQLQAGQSDREAQEARQRAEEARQRGQERLRLEQQLNEAIKARTQLEQQFIGVIQGLNAAATNRATTPSGPLFTPAPGSGGTPIAFQGGLNVGPVPGPLGAPRLIMAHGGEAVFNREDLADLRRLLKGSRGGPQTIIADVKLQGPTITTERQLYDFAGAIGANVADRARRGI